mmetsp:Transcript_152726/g.266715  ORF Transcript_152726/g.266715 Transcript_152726/m.266715 type:complete len:290 (-) Transcript_152726:183-1052(-)
MLARVLEAVQEEPEARQQVLQGDVPQECLPRDLLVHLGGVNGGPPLLWFRGLGLCRGLWLGRRQLRNGRPHCRLRLLQRPLLGACLGLSLCRRCSLRLRAQGVLDELLAGALRVRCRILGRKQVLKCLSGGLQARQALAVLGPQGGSLGSHPGAQGAVQRAGCVGPDCAPLHKVCRAHIHTQVPPIAAGLDNGEQALGRHQEELPAQRQPILHLGGRLRGGGGLSGASGAAWGRGCWLGGLQAGVPQGCRALAGGQRAFGGSGQLGQLCSNLHRGGPGKGVVASHGAEE